MHEAGFETHESIFTGPECDAILDAVAARVGDRDTGARARAGARHLLGLPAIAALANDERLLSIARAWLGDGALPFRATLFAKSSRANWLVAWHQDTALPWTRLDPDPEFGPWSTKAGVLYAHSPTWALARVLALRVHLDAATAENGPLRVVPRSHALGVLSDAQVADVARARVNLECLGGRGSVLAMRPLLIHASSKLERDVPRRVLHVAYAAALELRPGLRLAVC